MEVTEATEVKYLTILILILAIAYYIYSNFGGGSGNSTSTNNFLNGTSSVSGYVDKGRKGPF